jgi:predicted HTH transcriptional regulator
VIRTRLSNSSNSFSVKIERERLIVTLPVLSVKILKIVKEHGRAKISEIQSITQANRNTIKVLLRELVVEGYLIKQDKGKGTHYLPGQHSF